MILDLKQLFEVVGSRMELNETLNWSEEEIFGGKPFISPIQVTGKITNQAGIVLLDAAVSFEMQLTCDRCLDEFNRTYSYDFSHILVRDTATDNDEYIVLPDRLLNLDDLMHADVLLNLPSKLLCKEDCKGLCSVCGQNKNHQSCECKEKFGDPRFNVLDQLLK